MSSRANAASSRGCGSRPATSSTARTGGKRSTTCSGGAASSSSTGLSVFYRDAAGDLFHTYSTYARGLDPLVVTYTILDLVPKGRDEDQLGFTMEWVRHHDRYESGVLADADRPYWPEEASV
jgi:predicted dithiol-disulfide oxidoreductase (DUF899 family)